MQIKMDDQGYITGFAVIGGFVGGVEMEREQLPQDFEEDFFPRKWRVLESGMIALSGESRPPEMEPAPDPILQRMEEHEAALCELAEMIVGGGM